MLKRSQNLTGQASQSGFTLIEMLIALIILFIAVMGVFAAITYATKYNRGNSQRSQALAVMQREVELLRSAKFTPTVVSNVTTPTPTCATADDGSRDITGGVNAVQVRCGIDNTMYLVETTIDDDPAVLGTQVSPAALIKEITLQVTPVSPEGQTRAGQQTWVTGNPIFVVFRRVRAN
jgi:type II secretory pathway pseudopilin PulG